MIGLEAVATLFADLETGELVGWVERRWVQPEPIDDGGWTFREIDIARVRLIYDLRRELALPEDTMPLVLSLLDQVYELRCTLNLIGGVLADQPPAVKAAISAGLAAQRPPTT